MKRIKITCDKKYGGKEQKIDADFWDEQLLFNIVKEYLTDSGLNITKEIVDYYNDNHRTKGRDSFKTAENIKNMIYKMNKTYGRELLG